jgi:hypothetical protein
LSLCGSSANLKNFSLLFGAKGFGNFRTYNFFSVLEMVCKFKFQELELNMKLHYMFNHIEKSYKDFSFHMILIKRFKSNYHLPKNIDLLYII